MSEKKKTRVLIVDDSAVARDLLERGLSLDPDLEVVGKAADAYAARDKIVFLKPDVMTLDVEMPRMDGIEFLRRLIPQYPIPTVVVSAVTAEGSRRALEALEAGAVEVVGKPAAGERTAFREMVSELSEKLKAAAASDLSKNRRAPSAAAKPRPPIARAPLRKHGVRIIAIGASTGGTTALHRIVEALPDGLPPIVIVQHMPPVFTRLFAEALDRASFPRVVEAQDGDALAPGTVYIAPGDRHMRVVRRDGSYFVELSSEPKVSGHRPSADVLFNSVATAAGARSVGLLLTGMGKDGALGLAAMRREGARCLAQDEASSVVWGMPREAWESGAAEKLVSLDDAVHELLAVVGSEDVRA